MKLPIRFNGGCCALRLTLSVSRSVCLYVCVHVYVSMCIRFNGGPAGDVRCDGLWTCQDLLVLASRPAVVCLRERERGEGERES